MTFTRLSMPDKNVERALNGMLGQLFSQSSSLTTEVASLTDSVDGLGAKKYCINSLSRDMTAASGDKSYTGVGFKPSALIIVGGLDASNTWVVGLAQGASQGMICGYGSSTQIGVASPFYFIESSGNYNTATVKTWDTDGITLTWTKVGLPTITVTFYILFFR